MDQQRERIQDDLRGLVSGEVRCDDLTLAMYASDGSVYEVRPLGVVCPRGLADVVAAVQYAAEKQIPLHPRGAGSGLAGGALGPGLVLDLSRHFRRIASINDDSARVQAGVVHAALNASLAKSGRIFGPDPANSTVTTMGSVVALDASGSHFLRYGSARTHVKSLQVVLADGAVVELGREPLGSAGVANDVEGAQPQSRRCGELVSAAADVLLRNHETIADYRPEAHVNRAGYRLFDVLSEGHVDMARLMCGSEGTLGIVTEATVATQPLPQHVGVVLLLFDRLEYAARAVELLLPFAPAACDILDRRHLGLAREADVRFDLLVPATVEAALVVEFQCDGEADLRDRMIGVTRLVRDDRNLAIDARQTIDPEEVELYWQLATRVVPRLYRLRGSARPIPFVEDIHIPPAQLAEFLVALQNTLKQQQVTASLYGHAAQGRLHIRPFLDLGNPDDIGRMRVLADDVYHSVISLGGAIGGELGAGLSRTSFLRSAYSPLCDVFRELKQAFDPAGILNPGKIVGDHPQQLTSNLRRVRVAGTPLPPSGPGEFVAGAAVEGASSAAATAVDELPPTSVVPLELNWNGEDIMFAARACNGCGACRTQLPEQRMCPIFRAMPREEASPRAKANLLRSVLTGRMDRELLPADAFKSIADLCVHCHQCRLECPAGVDVPKLMVEAKAAHVSHNGLKPSDWLLTRLDLVGGAAMLVRPLANWAIGNRQMRWLLERLFGLAHGRKLPRVARRSFMRFAARRKLTRVESGSRRKRLRTATRRILTQTGREPPRRVLYFSDVYANYFDPQIGEALVAILAHHGVSVYVPNEPLQSGIAMVAMGAIARAKLLAARNVALLSDAVRQGYHIVASEPAAALCLTHEYPNLFDDEEARLVAANTSEACGYLWRMHLEKSLRLEMRPITATVAYHQPCHTRALGGGSPAANLLRLIPGLTVLTEDHGCSGMAGTFGLSRANYRTSLRAGWDLISWMRQGAMHAGATECSACKLQMEQGTAKPTLHPLKLLALSYGLMPELKDLLTRRSGELVVT